MTPILSVNTMTLFEVGKSTQGCKDAQYLRDVLLCLGARCININAATTPLLFFPCVVIFLTVFAVTAAAVAPFYSVLFEMFSHSPPHVYKKTTPKHI